MRVASERRWRHPVFIAAIWLLVVASAADVAAQTPAPPPIDYETSVRPIFESRCIACHSCYNAPCQLNLQSHAGALRGAASSNVYDATRAHSAPATRIGIDAATTGGWREKGFFDVLGAGAPDRSVLLRMLSLRRERPARQPSRQVADSKVCTPDPDDARLAGGNPALAMPYGLPPLADAEIETLRQWISAGAPGPASAAVDERKLIPAALRPSVTAWEEFLNEGSPRQRLVSRYLYEHLFLASLHFAPGPGQDDAQSPPTLFRLVRSRSPCAEAIDEIATRRPSEAPGVAAFHYCLRPLTGAPVLKTLIPYELSAARLARLKAQFLGPEWSLGSEPAYGDEQASNPFVTFAAIPVRARYQFLLDDARYHISTFIKGPVCNGTAAVDSIQEQFYVFFLRPDADAMVVSPDFEAEARRQLVLPGMWGSDPEPLQDLTLLGRLYEHRERYRKLRVASAHALRPAGYALDDIWDGDRTNPGALLTVLRHGDNAAVFEGAVGDLPKTGFVLDYPLFERLVYNLVVNFDVFGNIGHQVLTRAYMDLIRMEAEELFLSFLPPSQREPLRRGWYKGGLLTDIKLNYVFPLRGESQPTAISYRNPSAAKREFVERVIFEHFSPAVRGTPDLLNWRQLRDLAPRSPADPSLSPSALALRRIASVRAARTTPFARHFPELSLLLVRGRDGTRELFSLVHNREHSNVSWIMGDDVRLAPSEDTLTVRKGVLGAYPAMFFVVEADAVDAFARAAASIRSPVGYDALVERYGARRTSDRFWGIYDEIAAAVRASDPIAAGALDLTRYDLAAEQ